MPLGLIQDELSLTKILGVTLAPVTWLLGIGAGEAVAAAEILGAKMAVNELVAYTELTGSLGTLACFRVDPQSLEGPVAPSISFSQSSG